MNAVAHVETDDLKVLYQELILDHGKSPRNARLVEHATCTNEEGRMMIQTNFIGTSS